MLFEAGRATATDALLRRMNRGLWQIAAAAAVIVACGLGLAWHAERAGRRQLELALLEANQRSNETSATSDSPLPDRQETQRWLDSSSYIVLVHRLVPRGDADQIARSPATEPSPPRSSVPAAIQGTLSPRDLKRLIPL
jgi:hypothetical protein